MWRSCPKKRMIPSQDLLTPRNQKQRLAGSWSAAHCTLDACSRPPSSLWGCKCARTSIKSSSAPTASLAHVLSGSSKSGGSSVDTTPTCTRADALSSRAHITAHNSHTDPHSSNVVTSTLAQGKRKQCLAFLQKPFSSRCHVLVECPFRPLPSCRFIAHLFSLIDLVGKEQIKPLCLCSLERNVWLPGQSDSTQVMSPTSAPA